ncbi:MAG TPA: hypothetical protein VIH90_07230 [Candidatus Saccharimonadales bacterium]
MAYENSLMDEFMVPRDPEVAARLHGFYEAIRWAVRNSTNSEFFTYVNPEVSEGVPPTIAYWQTESESKTSRFVEGQANEPSIFAKGLRLPLLEELREVCLIVPGDDDVHTIFEQGGRLLERHSHILPRDHAGAQEFRFSDPFNYSLRVTANPGWEIVPPEKMTPLEDMVLTDNDMVLTSARFSELYGGNGSRHSWPAMLRVIERNKKDCPLTVVENDGELTVVGNIESAIEWFTTRGIKSEPVFVRVLRKAVGSEDRKV